MPIIYEILILFNLIYLNLIYFQPPMLVTLIYQRTTLESPMNS